MLARALRPHTFDARVIEGRGLNTLNARKGITTALFNLEIDPLPPSV